MCLHQLTTHDRSPARPLGLCGRMGALRESMKLRKGGDAGDWFFLAMSCHHLGRRTEARQHYDKAIAWMGQNKQALRKDPLQAEELRRFRDEAEEVLQLKKK
jgi:hypothetical protein